MTESTEKSISIHWVAATVLCVVSLLGGVWLGRVALFSSEEPAPLIVEVEVLDDELEVSGQAEYFEDEEIYILSLGTMPPAPSSSVYQVWVQSGDTVVPAGVLNQNSSRFAYAAYDGRYETMFITVEEGPFGVDEPTGEPIIEADLTQIEVEDED